MPEGKLHKRVYNLWITSVYITTCHPLCRYWKRARNEDLYFEVRFIYSLFFEQFTITWIYNNCIYANEILCHMILRDTRPSKRNTGIFKCPLVYIFNKFIFYYYPLLAGNRSSTELAKMFTFSVLRNRQAVFIKYTLLI